MASGKQESYAIHDGDIPCTPETENAYYYEFNICGDVTSTSIPSVCDKNGAALQYFLQDVRLLCDLFLYFVYFFFFFCLSLLHVSLLISVMSLVSMIH